MIRKFKRDHFRREVGNRNLSSRWERFQRNKYGRFYNYICRAKQR